MEQNSLPYRNRSEAPTSVILGLLLADPTYGPELLRRLANQNPPSQRWKMWDISNDPGKEEDLTINESCLEASSLVFPFRDTESQIEPKDHWRGEIDVVVFVPAHLIIGIELKILSSTSSIVLQMKDKMHGLKHLAKIYDCRNVAQVALTPNLPLDCLGINWITFKELHAILKNIDASYCQPGNILLIAIRQIEFVLDLIEPTSNSGWRLVKLDELQQMTPDPTNIKWVGVIEGISNLKLTTRTHWKVADEKLELAS
jgi:hypothetical protein